MSLNLSGKEITDEDNIFSQIKNPGKFLFINLSNNKLTILPEDLSSFKSLKQLDLSQNNFQDYNQIAKCLSTLPSLKILNINLTNQEHAILILSALPNLLELNGHNTKEENTEKINNPSNENNEYKETNEISFNDDFSLNSEVDTFNEIMQYINEAENTMKEQTNFGILFQQKLKEEIEKFNTYLELPDYLYKANIAKSKIDIYNFLFDKVLSILSNENNKEQYLINIITLIRSKISKNEQILYDIITSLRESIEKNFENYKDEIKETHSKPQRIWTFTAKIQNCQSHIKSNKFNLSKSSLLSILNDIFKFHIDSNKKNTLSKLPKDTLSTSIGNYLLNKYGLKSITDNWEKLILEGIDKYSNEDSEINLFKKILSHSLEESSYEVYTELKGICDNLLLSNIKEKNQYKPMNEINKLLNKKKSSFISYDEWKTILNVIFNNDNEVITNQIIDFITSKNDKDEKYKDENKTELNVFNATREVKRYHHKSKNLNAMKLNVFYKDFVKLLLEFQIRLREKYLQIFSGAFKKVDIDNDGKIDEEQFKDLMYVEFDVCSWEIDDIKERIENMLDVLDPFELNSITFSDCVNLLGKEKIEGMTFLDKIISNSRKKE